jgi:hypothetical protein
MKALIPLFSTCLVCVAARAMPAQTPESIAKAYVQAIVAGTGSKTAGTIDFAKRGCTPAKVFADECQGKVFADKDGKTFLMEAIRGVAADSLWAQSNIAELIPEADLKRVFGQLDDQTLENARQMLGYLSTKDNGWYSNLEGAGKAKAVLQRYLHSTGSGGMYGNYVWPFDRADAGQAKLTEAGIKVRINKVPSPSALRPNVLYYWALQTNFSDMAYPAGFSAVPTVANRPADLCKNSTTAWGHVGWQYSATQKLANWGGGGNGSGVSDYGCGGSNVTAVSWNPGVWYQYKVKRGANRGPKLWEWQGSIIDAVDRHVYDYTIFGGEYITYAVVWSELIGVRCDDPGISVEWREPYVGNDAGAFRVARIDKTFTSDACRRSTQAVVSRCPVDWRQDQGSDAQPAVHAKASELRNGNRERLTESCPRAADATEVAIAKAYVQAISGGGGPKTVSGAVDFTRNGCAPDAVWDTNKCQAAVFNGKDGKTILMETIASVQDPANWRNSNIATLIPEADLRRIMTDARYKNARDLFGYLSDPKNNWYPALAGAGRPKDVLRRYIEATR